MENPILNTGIFTLLGVLIGSLTTYAIAARTARLENQRHLRELGLKLALVNFEFFVKQSQTEANATNQVIPVIPLPVFIAEGIKLAEILSNHRLNPYEIGIEIKGLKSFRTTIIKGMDATT